MWQSSKHLWRLVNVGADEPCWLNPYEIAAIAESPDDGRYVHIVLHSGVIVRVLGVVADVVTALKAGLEAT